jgi:solute carrier family 30 (zinc transporter), member 2
LISSSDAQKLEEKPLESLSSFNETLANNNTNTGSKTKESNRNEAPEYPIEQKHGGNLNVESAYLHVLGDMLMSCGVIVAAIVIYIWPNAKIADPICTYLFSLIVGFTSFPVVKECVSVLMEGTPSDLDVESLKNDIFNVEGVEEVHDFHAWSVSQGKHAISCHIMSDKPFRTLSLVTDMCRRKYNVFHTTIQMELFSQKDYALKCENDLHD